MRFYPLLLIVFITAACTSSVRDKIEVTQKLAERTGFERSVFKTSHFDLLSYRRFSDTENKSVTLYIEGDGLAWRTRRKPSLDPTPQEPLVLKLAAIDGAPNVLYLARPCQYVRTEKCSQKYWTSHRAAPEVVQTYRDILEQLRAQYGFQEFHLVGYSGGATIALILAAQETDIVSVQTLAGNLSPAFLSHYHQVDSQFGSLEPLDFAQKLSPMPQRHIFGSDDSIVPPEMGSYYMRHLPDTNCMRMITLPEVTHHSGWEAYWTQAHSHKPECATQ